LATRRRRLTIWGQLLKRLGAHVRYVALYHANMNLAISSKFTWPTFGPYHLEEERGRRKSDRDDWQGYMTIQG